MTDGARIEPALRLIRAPSWRGPALAAGVFAVVVVGQVAGPGMRVSPEAAAWLTVFLAVVFQAAPFLAAGVAVAALIGIAVSRGALQAMLPDRPARAVLPAGLAGFVLPGCECASVPVARSLMTKGVSAAPALTFMLAAPAINPIVLLSTFVAFPANPMMVNARLVAGFLTAVAVGWLALWLRGWVGVPAVAPAAAVAGRSRLEGFRKSSLHDLVHTGGYLVLGAAIAASAAVLVPADAVAAIAASPALSVGAAGGLAVVAAICSEADAFVAASFPQFSATAQLVFLTVGPMVDVKLIGMQAGVFGPRFALRFGALTFVTAVLVACLIGVVML